MLSLPIAKCPATFCRLFAEKGSPWTGERNADCTGCSCGWWKDNRCFAVDYEFEDIGEVDLSKTKPECRFESACQWQRQLGGNLCPPRLRLLANQGAP